MTRAPRSDYPKELYQGPLYKAWVQMKTRCNNSNYVEFHYYGGRGIRVCERWALFANFLEDMGPTFVEGLTLDRIDSDGDYTPDNCRWATQREQQSNRRNTRVIEYRGERRTMREWSEELDIKLTTLRGRYYNTGCRDLALCLERG